MKLEGFAFRRRGIILVTLLLTFLVAGGAVLAGCSGDSGTASDSSAASATDGQTTDEGTGNSGTPAPGSAEEDSPVIDAQDPSAGETVPDLEGITYHYADGLNQSSSEVQDIKWRANTRAQWFIDNTDQNVTDIRITNYQGNLGYVLKDGEETIGAS